jgi:hypothetical protein
MLYSIYYRYWHLPPEVVTADKWAFSPFSLALLYLICRQRAGSVIAAGCQRPNMPPPRTTESGNRQHAQQLGTEKDSNSWSHSAPKLGCGHLHGGEQLIYSRLAETPLACNGPWQRTTTCWPCVGEPCMKRPVRLDWMESPGQSHAAEVRAAIWTRGHDADAVHMDVEMVEMEMEMEMDALPVCWCWCWSWSWCRSGPGVDAAESTLSCTGRALVLGRRDLRGLA